MPSWVKVAPEFKGDAHHLPETILTLRTPQVHGRTPSEIESWLTQEDVQRFALIRQEFQRDLVNSERAHAIERP
jgi:hypothetical protein